MSDPTLLQSICDEFGVEGGWEKAETEGRERLKENTTWASERGVFGVPAMFLIEGEEVVGERFYFGQVRERGKKERK